MTSLANPDDEQSVALALRLSQLSYDDSAPPPSEELASANHTPRPCTPTNDEKDDLALAPSPSLPPPDDLNGQAPILYRTRSVPTSENISSSTTLSESGENALEIAPNSPQIRELNRLGESRAAIEDGPAPPSVPLVEVRTASSY